LVKKKIETKKENKVNHRFTDDSKIQGIGFHELIPFMLFHQAADDEEEEAQNGKKDT